MIAVNLNSKIINEATPVAKPARPISVAWMLGASDAEANASCTPEQFFVSLDSIQNYCEGYLSVNWSPMAVKIAKHYGCEVTK